MQEQKLSHLYQLIKGYADKQSGPNNSSLYRGNQL